MKKMLVPNLYNKREKQKIKVYLHGIGYEMASNTLLQFPKNSELFEIYVYKHLWNNSENMWF